MMITNTARVIRCFTVGLVFLTVLPACSTGSGPYRPADSARRDTSKARTLTAEAADLVFTDPEKAESLLREALTADLYHGPAHNNLGVLFLNRGMLYEAASEFEWAGKLMPGHPDPRLNLAMTLEQAGRIDEATKAYQTALEIYPGHLPTIMGLTRMQVRNGRTDPETQENLRAIVMRSPDPAWREWAEHTLIRYESMPIE